MEAFAETLARCFAEEDGYWSFKFGEGYELTVEPLLFDGQHYVALYRDSDLLTDKPVVKAGM